MTPVLSILIPTLEERKPFLDDLIRTNHEQLVKYGKLVEVLTDSRDRSVKTGEKRNDLLARARGEYVWFIDDDDYIYPYALDRIFQAIKTGPDVIGINGIMTTDGKNQQGWEIRLGHPFVAEIRDGKEYYLRYPNHITPMKRELAVQVKFPRKTIFEDFEWATALRDTGLLKTQVIIEEPMYHYRVRSKK